MYPTYEYIKKVSEDTTLTPSQKMHEIFKNSKTQPLRMWIEKQSMFQKTPIDPSVKIDQAEVVEVSADGQILTFRYPDNSYHFIDAGLYIEIEGVDHIAVLSLDKEPEGTQNYFDDLLMTDDSPLVFYRGWWIDTDLQEFFLNSYPQN